MTEQRTSRQTCTSHCSQCDRHFHGDTAFDLHRRDGQCQNPETLTTAKGAAPLAVWTATGYCDLLPGCWQGGVRVRYEHPVVIWQQAVSQAARDRLAALRG